MYMLHIHTTLGFSIYVVCGDDSVLPEISQFGNWIMGYLLIDPIF